MVPIEDFPLILPGLEAERVWEMPLKPSDIEQKTFSTALRGYDLNEVDDFLDDVIATIRDLEEQVAAKGGKTAPASGPAVDESAVGRVLVAAQSAADQILADARAEADRIKEEAKGEAETIINERDAKKAEAEQQIGELRLKVDNVRRELAVLATVVADGLEEMDSSIRSAEVSVAATGMSSRGEYRDDIGEGPDGERLVESIGAVGEETSSEDMVGVEVETEVGEVEETAETVEAMSDADEVEEIAIEDVTDMPGDGPRGVHESSADNDISIELDDTGIEETVHSD
jgi:cell division initiation protein